MHETQARPDPLDVLATEFTARQRRGECPTIDEYTERYPELAEEIRVLFPTIATLERLKVSRQRTPDGRVSLAGSRLERLGDFRVIREIGRGGMGIVYEAEQQSLARRVAVKVLPRQALVDSRHLQRFQREAQTAAALHHTNIVPVFGVGQHDGFHYYVMQLIDGVGLDRVLARLESGGASQSGRELSHVVRQVLKEHELPASNIPSDGQSSLSTEPLRSRHTMGGKLPQNAIETPLPPALTGSDALRASHWQSVARLGIQIADALQSAHAQGTLHRDIKPANLIIDRQNVVWVADFGLAKALEGEPGSHSNEIVGTLAYMAPEQLQGRADHRSDIYSLGLTLYELLTLRPAFEQADRTQLLQRIVKNEPPRPRQIRPEIPRDLETIVLKAMVREPSHRYASAAELAADLRCFLEDRPIEARRATAAERAWRWCRRNPVVAVLSATAAMLLVLVAVTASLGYARTTTALAGERTQRQHAEAATDVAVQVLDRIYERFAPSDFTATIMPSEQEPDRSTEVKPILSEGAAAVLEDLLEFYDQLAESGQDDSLYREKVALANRRVGDIRHHLGQCQQAEDAYRQALDLYRTIDQLSGGEPHVVEIAVLQNELAIMAVRLGRPDDARGQFWSNLEFLEQLGDEAVAAPEVRDQRDRAREFLAWLEDPEFPPPGRPPGLPREEFGPPGKGPASPRGSPLDGPPPGRRKRLPGAPAPRF
jgi:serine/threonine protein kinase